MKKLVLIIILTLTFYFILGIENIKAWKIECIYEGNYDRQIVDQYCGATVTHYIEIRVNFSPPSSSLKFSSAKIEKESSSMKYTGYCAGGFFEPKISTKAKGILEEYKYPFIFDPENDRELPDGSIPRGGDGGGGGGGGSRGDGSGLSLRCPPFLACYGNRKEELIFTIGDKETKIDSFYFNTNLDLKQTIIIDDVTPKEVETYKNPGKLGDLRIPYYSSIPLDCSDFEDSEGNIIKEIYKLVMIVVPILVILLGSLDFAKAIFAGNDENMKKFQMDFLKRLLAAVILFLAPSIIRLMLYLAVEKAGIVVPNLILCFFE